MSKPLYGVIHDMKNTLSSLDKTKSKHILLGDKEEYELALTILRKAQHILQHKPDVKTLYINIK